MDDNKILFADLDGTLIKEDSQMNFKFFKKETSKTFFIFGSFFI